MGEVSILKLKDFELVFFTVPCSICGKPMVFTHRDSNWQKEVKPRLHIMFSDWFHASCKKKKG
jgi:hypothetical protein